MKRFQVQVQDNGDDSTTQNLMQL